MGNLWTAAPHSSLSRLSGALILAVSICQGAMADWTVTNLAPPDTLGSHVNGLDSLQQVGGSDSTRAWLWSGTPGSRVELTPGFGTATAYATHNGQQVGMSSVSNFPNHATLWTGTAASRVDLNPTGKNSSVAYGVRSGRQVGSFSKSGVDAHACLWTGTAASNIDLSPAGTVRSEAFGMDEEQQVGYAVPGILHHAALWSGTAASWVDLNPSGIVSSEAQAIANGQQVGYSLVSGLAHASLWSGTSASWIDLNPAKSQFSYARGVSDGMQVGYSQIGGRPVASLWIGSAASWVNLGSFLPANYLESRANAIWTDSTHIYVGGDALNGTTSSYEAQLWTLAVPSPGALPVVACVGCLTWRRRMVR